MVRSIGPVTIDLRLVGDEYNMFTPTLELKVAGCGATGWSIADSISPVGENAAQRAGPLRDLMVQQFEKAHQICAVPPDIKAHLLDGVEAAYARFEAIGR